MNTAALGITGLTKQYRDFTLDSVSFDVPYGSVVGFIGENGAGKSTTLKAILGLVKKDEGTISVLGKREQDIDFATRNKIGVVFDGNNYPDKLTPKQLGRLLHNVYISWDEEKLWVIIGVLFAFCCISIMTDVYKSAEHALLNISKDIAVPLLGCSVYSAINLLDDFSNGLLQHYIAGGYGRISIICAKFVHYIFGCSILLLVYPLLCVSLTVAVRGVETLHTLHLQQKPAVVQRPLEMRSLSYRCMML